MQIIDVTRDNLDTEHICCAISEKKGESCVADKKAWMRQRFDDGLVFKKFDVRGKVFIEYIPAEKAFSPIHAPGYFFIDCLWVSGQYKGQGYASQLLDACIADARAQGKRGLVAVSSARKRPFLADRKFLLHKGFVQADTAPPMFELLYLPLTPDAAPPSFLLQAKRGHIDEMGMVVYYTNQCPFANTYTLRALSLAQRVGHPVSVHRLDTPEEAQRAPTPYPTYTFYYNGAFITHEILSEGQLERFMEREGLL